MRMPLMPWQQQVADVGLEVDGRGRFTHDLVVISTPRRSGKTSLLAPVMAHRMLIVPRARVWLTAQRREDARDTWGELSDKIESSPLADMTKRRSANGQEQLLLGQSTLRPFNGTSETALHGKESDLVLVDEAFAFSAEQGKVILQAVVPTQATRPMAQIWIVSTAGTAASTWLRGYVDRYNKLLAENGDTGRAAFFDWGIPADTEELDDIELYARHHPAVGHTIEVDALYRAREAMPSASEFARAYGNFWLSSAQWAIAPSLWNRQRVDDPASKVEMRRHAIAFAVEANADRTGGCIVVAGRTADGRRVVELVDVRPGVGWLTERVHELVAKWRPAAVVVDPGGPAGLVYRKLSEDRRRYTPLLDFDAGILAAAETEFLDGLVVGDVVHRSDDRLDAAVRATGTRRVRELEVWSRLMAEDGTSPAPLIAAKLALYGLMHPPELMVPTAHAAS